MRYASGQLRAEPKWAGGRHQVARVRTAAKGLRTEKVVLFECFKVFGVVDLEAGLFLRLLQELVYGSLFHRLVDLVLHLIVRERADPDRFNDVVTLIDANGVTHLSGLHLE